jgi:hypothetical protein
MNQQKPDLFDGIIVALVALLMLAGVLGFEKLFFGV